MARSWKMGTAFGIGIYIHWTFWLLLGWVFLSNYSHGHAGIASYAVLLVMAIFGCVVLHELGHALMARYFRIPTRDITLYPIGGVARLERMSEQPREELLIAVAGPAVNLGIAFVLSSLWVLGHHAVTSNRIVDALQSGSFALTVAAANLVLLAFNLLPAFPMDGGRVFRAALVPAFGRLRATRIAVHLSSFMAAAFVLLAVAKGMPMLMLVALFVFVAGRQELGAIEAQQMSEARSTLPGTPFSVQTVPASPAGFSGFTWDSRTGLCIQWINGRPVDRCSI